MSSVASEGAGPPGFTCSPGSAAWADPGEPARPTGPVELALIGFPGDRLDGSIVPALAELVDQGTIRIVDLAVVRKDPAGRVSTAELGDLDVFEAAAFEALDGEIGELFSHHDLAVAGRELSPGTSAVLLLWENAWASRLAAEVASAGGQVVAHERVPARLASDALAALEAEPAL